MARTLMITFKNNGDAEKIVKHIHYMQGGYTKPDAIEVMDENEFIATLADPDLVHMDAMVARPTAWCTCGSTRGAGKRTFGYAQSKTYHWWVHTRKPDGSKCMKPTRYIVDHWISNMLNGAKDLLGQIIPDHEEVLDHLDRGARFRVRKQGARDEAAELARQR